MNAAEVLIAAAITITVTSAVVGLVQPAQASFQAQADAGDMHQRLRAAVDALTSHLVIAGAGLPATTTAAVLPYRPGDSGVGTLYRPDAVTVRHVQWGQTAVVSRTYYLQANPSTNINELRQTDGVETDLPVVDHVSLLRFEYFDEAGAGIGAASFQNGPWVAEEDGSPVDADVLRIRRVGVQLRIQPALQSVRVGSTALFHLPDAELRFEVAPRNLVGVP